MKEVKVRQWTSAYAAAITFNFYLMCKFIRTEVSSSMILTRKIKLKWGSLVLNKFIFHYSREFFNANHTLCYKLFLYISIQSFSLRYFVVFIFSFVVVSASEFCKKKNDDFKQKKKKTDVM